MNAPVPSQYKALAWVVGGAGLLQIPLGIFTCVVENIRLEPVPTSATSDHRRPVYVFGHMANSLRELDDFIEQGVNAIEADVTFAPDGTATKFYHGPGCDYGRDCEQQTDVPVYLTYLKDTVSAENGRYRNKMLLLYVDIKTANLNGSEDMYAGGVSLAENLMSYLWSGVPPSRMVNVLLSIFSTADKEVLKGAMDRLSISENHFDLLEHVGFDVSGNNFLSTIASTFEKLGVTRHRWQGDGTNNRFIDIYPALRMSWVTARRSLNSSVHDYVDKAYVWTADHAFTIRRFFRKNIDGIVTNSPGNALKVLEEDEFSMKYRLANSLDDPWKRIV
ncbi:dermonecrotic toxin SPH-like isoform X1 [Dermacentor andersoni]|uniref:dermonecrotic toxin SPH-like isoform X1 n=1 Tax=Dermacentor andersoni TaxID=34620 RepID=UPI0024160892|nr:dermonecrotic toxin SPH-like isoform X1 [Dermacentor andersoni]